ncbi:MAG: hypothetical protein CME65_02290 [Halobacteriovoraceae bacterium]|nr:hypothetical protein [Halobacteriovoraceae bacterium]
MINKTLLVFGLGFITSSTYAMKCNVDLNLEEFKTNPSKFLNAPIPKKDANCEDNIFRYFERGVVDNQEYIRIKDEYRKNICHTDPITMTKVCLETLDAGEDVIEGRAPISSVDRAENLVTGGVVESNIREMARLGLENGESEIKPWSDWYWPIAVGQLSYRYQDEVMMEAYENADISAETAWPWLKQWHEDNPALMLDVNYLSPAEKYDILVGDDNFTFTKSMFNAGAGYQEKYGKVETWMGICHGWSPASYMLPRPVKTIEVTAADGVTQIEFKPSDLKALGSQLWATGFQRTKFIGGRCNSKDPAQDSNGRILDDKCFDNNPGTWHKTVVNQVGKLKSTFVMDATFDYEVWNHPVTAYSYVYFNPITMEEFDTLEDAIVSRREHRNDKFRRYRSRSARYLVGVKMEVEYLVETMPTTLKSDSPVEDAHNYAYYAYDLELDRNYNIIGGEWYQNKHPDFLWTPFENSHATSSVDNYLPATIDLKNLGQYNLSRLAPHSSQRAQPIGKLVEALLQAANEN